MPVAMNGEARPSGQLGARRSSDAEMFEIVESTTANQLVCVGPKNM